MTNHLFDLIRAHIPDPAKTLIETGDGRIISYGEALEISGKMASLLVSKGVRPGDRVAVQVEKSPEAILLFLGCVRAGAVFLPLNTAYALAELEYFFGDAEPALVVCDPARHGEIGEIARRLGSKACLTLDGAGRGSLTEDARDMPANFVEFARAPDDLAAILYTSGTTGRSKGAMLTHDNLASNALTLVDYWQFTASDVLLHALPVYHTHGLFVAVNTILLAGGSMLFLAKFEADQVFRLLPRATTMMGVPTFYVRMLDDDRLTAAACAHMRLFISGSAPLLEETHRAWRERTGTAILERYGMTETNMSTSNPYDGERIAGTVGLPLPGVSLRITDPETGAPLGVDEIGMIEVKGPNVFKGYWRMPEKTAAEFRADGFFITGDLATLDARGYVRIVGRGKDLVISGGLNVYPKEVETEIDAIPGVLESAVFGVGHKDLGEAVVAAVVPRSGADVNEATITAALDGRLARFKQPRRVIMVPELPRNAMGKVQKNLLRERYGDLFRT
jgi:malonyl-CoA/methylmalonyl-CoA synthetase